MPDLVERATRFRTILDAARKAAGTAGFDWYPYNSLSGVHHLTRLLGDAHEDVLEAGKRKGILDLGCGDGDLAFFWESQGYAVTGIDYPASNQNGMRGLRALRRELGSKIAIREIDVDNEFPRDTQYGLTLCLGLLYHLKNPFFVLEHVARVSQYCVLSTRIARNLPGGYLWRTPSCLPPGRGRTESRRYQLLDFLGAWSPAFAGADQVGDSRVFHDGRYNSIRSCEPRS